MKKLRRNIFLYLLLGFFQLDALYAYSVDAIIETSLDWGGKKLYEIHAQRRSTKESVFPQLTTGGGPRLSSGFRIRGIKLFENKDYSIDFKSTLGIKFNSLDVVGDDGGFYRFPLEAIIYLPLNKFFTFGVGANYYINPIYKDTNGKSIKVDSPSPNPLFELIIYEEDADDRTFSIAIRVGYVKYDIEGQKTSSDLYYSLSCSWGVEFFKSVDTNSRRPSDFNRIKDSK